MLDPPWVIGRLFRRGFFIRSICIASRANRIVTVCGSCGLVHVRRNTRRNFPTGFSSLPGLLGLPPDEVMMVAAHRGELEAEKKVDFKRLSCRDRSN
jgi:hypothetical protein